MVGDRWTLLIVREVLCGRGRFSEMRDRLGIAPTMLAARLNRLVEEGFLTRETTPEDGRGTLYRATPAAQPLGAVIASLEAFADGARPANDERGAPPPALSER